MIYTVQIKRNPFEPNVDYTFADTYLQGCERQFDTKEQAVSYLNTFEDWEQDLLCIDSFLF
jgi:hypothetical protein